MPINAYTGLMGSGKSYECVATPILCAIKMGRRVVTNVEGVDSEKCRQYLVEHHKTDINTLGHIVHCTNEVVRKTDFLPHGTEEDTFCQPGDLVCIDEAWRFWGNDQSLLSEHKIFFAEHRHYVHPLTKVSCDLVLMVQDITMLHRNLRVLVEVTFRMQKVKSLGLSKIYRVEMYEGYKLTRKSKVSVENKKYNAAIFALYSSYVGGQGTEKQVDTRQNILRQPKVWVMVISVIALFVWSVRNVLAFFRPAASFVSSDSLPVSQKVSNKVEASKPVLTTVPLSLMSSDPAWRLVGAYTSGNTTYAVYQSASGSTRIEEGASPSAFMGLRAQAFLDGRVVRSTTTFSPSTGPSLQFGDEKK